MQQLHLRATVEDGAMHTQLHGLGKTEPEGWYFQNYPGNPLTRRVPSAMDKHFDGQKTGTTAIANIAK